MRRDFSYKKVSFLDNLFMGQPSDSGLAQGNAHLSAFLTCPTELLLSLSLFLDVQRLLRIRNSARSSLSGPRDSELDDTPDEHYSRAGH